MNVEELRRKYRPDSVLALFVGESAPAGGTFFYAGNSQMYRYMREVFGQPPDFLEWFKAKGYYLDDLSPRPINWNTTSERRKAHRDNIPGLAQRIGEYDPIVIVTVLKSIGPAVEAAIEMASSRSQHHIVAFPGNGQQGRFRREMAEIIPKLP